MTDAVEDLKQLLSRWIADPGADYPYVLTVDRFDSYRADEDEMLEEDVELDFAAGSVGLPGVETRARGREEFWNVWRSWLEMWEEYRMRFTNWEQHGAAVVVDLEVEAFGKISGAPAKLSVAQVYVLREGRLASLRVYPSRRVALASLEGASR